MTLKFIGIIALIDGLAACDVATHPVAVVGPGKTVYRGTATAALLEGGWFDGDVSGVLHQCGLTGIGTATYQSALRGGGQIAMPDATRWQFIFGRGALSI